ncbi:hypothetical protein ACQUFD_18030, partial [Enterococcus gallinarum]
AKEKMKAKKVSIVFASDCAYCADLASAFETEFKKAQGNEVSRVTFLEADTDFSGLAEKVKSFDPDVVLVPNHELIS